MSRHKKLELTPRLQALADWVPVGERVADIGTDHGYLPIWLLRSGICPGAIAGDLRERPLARARQAAVDFGVQDRMDTRLCDGLSAVGPEEVSTVVIAGMGGETIAGILAAAPWTADGCHTLLLQPMTRPETLRAALASGGYRIVRERLVLDRGTLYPVLAVRGGSMQLTPGQAYCGTDLTNDPLGDRYLIERIIRVQNTIYGLRQSAVEADRARLEENRSLLKELFEMREAWRVANCTGN